MQLADPANRLRRHAADLRRGLSEFFRPPVALAAIKPDFVRAMLGRDFSAANALLAQSIKGVSVSVQLDPNIFAGAGVPHWAAAGRTSVFSFHDRVYAAPTELIFSRWFDFLPVVIRTMEQAAPNGSCLLNLGDEGHAPGLAFCDTRPEYDLVPDASFLCHRGYADLARGFAARAIPMRDRAPVAFWRGVTTGIRTGDVVDLPRVQLCLLGQQMGARADMGITSLAGLNSAQEVEMIQALNIMVDYVPMELLDRYRVHIDIDGNSNSWPGLINKLRSGSPVIKVASPSGFRQWYYHRLVPWEHYVPVRSDMSDLEEKIDYLLGNMGHAEEIGRCGQALAQGMTFDREVDWAVPVVSAALRRTPCNGSSSASA